MAADPAEKLYTTVDYWKLPDSVRSELIEGVFFAMTRPSIRHQRIVAQITRTLINYVEEHGGRCQVLPAPVAVQLFEDDLTWVEPDIVVVCDPGKLEEYGCVGAPDLVMEIVSPSSRKKDYQIKPDLYRKAGVREVWIVDYELSRVTVFRNEHADEGNISEPEEHAFTDAVPVGIWDGLEIAVGSLL